MTRIFWTFSYTMGHIRARIEWLKRLWRRYIVSHWHVMIHMCKRRKRLALLTGLWFFLYFIVVYCRWNALLFFLKIFFLFIRFNGSIFCHFRRLGRCFIVFRLTQISILKLYIIWMVYFNSQPWLSLWRVKGLRPFLIVLIVFWRFFCD